MPVRQYTDRCTLRCTCWIHNVNNVGYIMLSALLHVKTAEDLTVFLSMNELSD